MNPTAFSSQSHAGIPATVGTLIGLGLYFGGPWLTATYGGPPDAALVAGTVGLIATVIGWVLPAKAKAKIEGLS